MAFQLSPGVNVTEIDLTTIIPTVSTTDAAFVGEFRWGPCNEITLVSSEDELAKSFGKPDMDNAVHFFQAASFLAYGNRLRLVRASNIDAANASASADAGYCPNNEYFDHVYQYTGSDIASARYPGVMGNGIQIAICPSAAAFKNTVTGVSTPTDELADRIDVLDDSFISVGTEFSVTIGGVRIERRIIAKDNSDIVNYPKRYQLDSAVPSPFIQSADSVAFRWEFAEFFGNAPGTSDWAANNGQSNDECHAIVVDGSGKFSGMPGLVVEKYSYLSKLEGAKLQDGSANFFADAINQRSKYVRIITRTLGVAPVKETFRGGANGSAITLQECELGIDLFKNSELVDIALVISTALDLAGEHYDLAKYITENICEYRKDCICLLSPHKDSVVNIQDPLPYIIEDREISLQMSSSYAVMDTGWKYMYDKYNDQFRWVPTNADVAGLCVRTDNERNPWWSPAGLNRGQLKNVIKLAWSPDHAERDDLYQHGINPIVAMRENGFVLFGDKTLLAKPSAFDRINVRRLFIVIEKAIALAAKFFLFEFNDAFTRAQFRAMVEPYLRYVQGARGIYDFRVVCDESNNTGEVIDRNEFVGDIYVKPARSINFIQLNFIAVRTSVAFEEVVGKF